ncbi:MAG: hypothetical protein K2N48_04660, partial [Muribaculaceae bacterium]|nr:hypothetical protein [Muribaculaceae bacterium]
MKNLVTLAGILALLILFQDCRRHSSTVAPYGWPSIAPAFDSLTVEAERLYFIDADPDSLRLIVDSMEKVASVLNGKQKLEARACAGYWRVCLNAVVGCPYMVDRLVDSISSCTNTPGGVGGGVVGGGVGGWGGGG